MSLVTRALAFAVLAAPGSFAQTTTRVSVGAAGGQGDSYCEYISSLSPDGRYVAFSSRATNLVGGDTNGFTDVFLRDRQNGTTTRLSVDSAGVQGNGGSESPVLAADGRYAAFDSGATNLVPGDTNGSWDVFVRDLQTGTMVRASVSSVGVQGNSHSGLASISADGRYVAFASGATNLVPGDTNGVEDVFVRDVQNGTTVRASVDGAGGQASYYCLLPSISADGRYVVFESGAPNLVAGDTNGNVDVFLRDLQAGTTTLVSLDSTGAQGSDRSDRAFLAANGRYVAFQSAAQLDPSDTNVLADVYVRDLQGGTTTLVSVDSFGTQGDKVSLHPTITPDGRYVAFMSEATNLVPGDSNESADAFVHDVQTGTTTRISVDSFGSQGNSDSAGFSGPRLSADGRYVAFASIATNLVQGDTNWNPDVFVRDVLGGTSFTSLCDPGSGGVVGCPCSNPAAGSLRGCDNSSGTGGAMLSAAGATTLSSDSLVFTTSGERPTATSVLLQGTTVAAGGITYGQGVRCVGGTLKRLFTKSASGGSITAPDFGAGDPTVSAQSAAKGNPIFAGQSRWYLVFYRDPFVLGGCPATSTFNATQTGRADWSP